MTKVWVYDVDAEQIDKICEKNDITSGYLIQLLLDHADDILEEEGLEKA